ncbi:hypothetical protein K493DRAFT_110683 [Basidiobolus meristosporus CBS 931.73]|uniref:Uncharacterized protein n=1 Tax=Basidiobolus meristosporus CBS 931.73 TaxID=1314790 RepID=A0A1Y1WQX2_9FUNG|nr:hypothetical protein K493DRAFT_110683 [Basidiobolus meristosporus CBS 931.73]|eukprot:ORX75785.1 hypothetical protein K493DRAFT_110683 [Basidiobolus meristosporus CBS 931.73]
MALVLVAFLNGNLTAHRNQPVRVLRRVLVAHINPRVQIIQFMFWKGMGNGGVGWGGEVRARARASATLLLLQDAIRGIGAGVTSQRRSLQPSGVCGFLRNSRVALINYFVIGLKYHVLHRLASTVVLDVTC